MNRIIFIVIFLCFHCHLELSGQPGLTFEIKKPQKFENKKLGSEKTGEKKFTKPRRFIQNTVTHYNWYFNAYNRLDEVIARVKDAHRDDYSQLLPFYNYSLEKTALEKSELDSVIHKSTAGILIHDLRNDWIDNLYMLLGKAYYFKNELDSAYLTFQYINFAFAPKEKDGYDKPIGSNSTEGGTAFSISSKEKTGVVKKVFSTPPSRNESFIWQIRTFLAKDEYPEAAGLIETLRNDPIFPERLHNELYEVQALYFYKQGMYDSAATYLAKSLTNAENKQESARWEYLIAQMYERSNQPLLAEKFYQKAIKHTYDPIMEVYARLNSIRQNKGDEIAIQQNIDELLKMGKKERFLIYRDIIYFTAAQIELERNNIPAAKVLLLKSTQAQNTNLENNQRTKAFLLLGDLSFNEKNYSDASRFYDSVNTNDVDVAERDSFDKRKNLLRRIVDQQEIIYRNDSLQRLANMNEPDRDAFVKKLVKQLRKKQGIKEEEPSSVVLINDKNLPPDLFGTTVKGEWYFHNPALKARGFNEFRAKWGNRSNVDNWRRLNAVNQVNASRTLEGKSDANKEGAATAIADISYEALVKNIPLTPQQLVLSNDSIETATLALGKLYFEGLEDYTAAIETLEAFLKKFPNSNKRPEALLHLFYCYQKTGNTIRADEVSLEMKQKFPGSEHEKVLTGFKEGKPLDPGKSDMTKRYENIYNLFIEGKFDTALLEKKIADSLYSTNYWTPQLLYIQSIYHVRQRQDEEARKILLQIIQLYPSSPLNAKAQTLIEVIAKRKEIEDYLTKLEIKKVEEDTIANKEIPVVTPSKPAVRNDQRPVITVPVTTAKKDTTKINSQPVKPAFSSNKEGSHFAAVVLDKVDHVYITETRNAFNRYNKEKYYNKTIEITNVALDDNIKLVVMNFENADAALEYSDKIRKVAASEIIPWLPVGKYSFIIISPQNLEILRTTKSVADYKIFLNQLFPGRF